MDTVVSQARHVCCAYDLLLHILLLANSLLTVHMLPTARVVLRNRISTIIRLVVAPFLFILLVFVIDRAISSGNQSIAGMIF